MSADATERFQIGHDVNVDGAPAIAVVPSVRAGWPWVGVVGCCVVDGFISAGTRRFCFLFFELMTP